jgi:tetratricopeptide (TPR) repeat protein
MPSDEEARRGLASAYLRLAINRSDQTAVAFDNYEKALKLFEELLASHPDDGKNARNVALVHKYMADKIQTLMNDDPPLGIHAGNWTGALEHLHKAQELDQKRSPLILTTPRPSSTSPST